MNAHDKHIREEKLTPDDNADAAGHRLSAHKSVSPAAAFTAYQNSANGVSSTLRSHARIKSPSLSSTAHH